MREIMFIILYTHVIYLTLIPLSALSKKLFWSVIKRKTGLFQACNDTFYYQPDKTIQCFHENLDHLLFLYSVQILVFVMPNSDT